MATGERGRCCAPSARARRAGRRLRGATLSAPSPADASTPLSTRLLWAAKDRLTELALCSGASGSPKAQQRLRPRVSSRMRPVKQRDRRLAGRLVLGASGAAALAALLLVATGEAGTRYANCGPADARTIIANERIRVYKDADDDVVACLEGTDVRRTLESPRDTYYVFRAPALQLRGTLIGSAIDFCDPQADCETSIAVQDLSRASEGSGLLNGSTGAPRRLVKVGSLRFRPNGSVAWIACSENDPQVFSASRQPNCVRAGRDRIWVMRKIVGASKAEVLDTGRHIDPSSLRLSGQQLTWREAGRRRTRQLP